MHTGSARIMHRTIETLPTRTKRPHTCVLCDRIRSRRVVVLRYRWWRVLCVPKGDAFALGFLLGRPMPHQSELMAFGQITWTRTWSTGNVMRECFGCCMCLASAFVCMRVCLTCVCVSVCAKSVYEGHSVVQWRLCD